jgi:gluconate 2-dehydrogenase gamma chain
VENSVSRRAFLGNAAATFAFALLSSATPDLLLRAQAHAQGAVSGKPAFRFLTPAEAADFEAFAAQILPSDDTPGAREAGAVYFIDYVLAEVNPEQQGMFRDALASLADETAEIAGDKPFASLSGEQQIAIMKSMEKKADAAPVAIPKQRRAHMDHVHAFGALRAVTLVGCFCDPSLHGNRDKVGWKLINFDDQAYWAPPFGYYDAKYNAEAEKKKA